MSTSRHEQAQTTANATPAEVRSETFSDGSKIVLDEQGILLVEAVSPYSDPGSTTGSRPPVQTNSSGK